MAAMQGMVTSERERATAGRQTDQTNCNHVHFLSDLFQPLKSIQHF